MADYARYTEARVNASEYMNLNSEEYRALVCQRVGKATEELLFDVTDGDGPEEADKVIMLAVFKAPAIGDYDRWIVSEVKV